MGDGFNRGVRMSSLTGEAQPALAPRAALGLTRAGLGGLEPFILKLTRH